MDHSERANPQARADEPYARDVESYFYNWDAVRRAREAAPKVEAEPKVELNGDLVVIRDAYGSLKVNHKGEDLIDFIGAHQLFNKCLRDTANAEMPKEKYGDDYDIISFLIDPAYLPSIGSGATPIFNKTRGIGLPVRDDRAQWGSTRLLHHTHHTAPFNPRGLLHELGHLWLAYVNYYDDLGKTKRTLLHDDFPFETSPGQPQERQQEFHWGRWVDHRNSCMSYDRHEWRSHSDGTYSYISHCSDEGLGSYFGYSELDLYLMGLIPDTDVAQWKILRDPNPKLPEANDLRSSGPHTAHVTTVSVGQVEQLHGKRVPDYSGSQRVFRQAFCAIIGDPQPHMPFIRECERIVRIHEARFRWATSGRAVVDTRLLKPNHGDIDFRDDKEGKRNAIWVRNCNDNESSHQVPLSGQSNWVKLRVHNHGNAPYDDVTVNVYAAAKSDRELLYPADCQPNSLIGSRVVSVPAWESVVVTVEWRASLFPATLGGTEILLAELMPLGTKHTSLHSFEENEKLATKAVADVTS
jgi:hypothetical protein